ncbi:MAG: hypothetical protein VB118_09495 [Oscillospiraceae bacterium]|nr:hypothetical protein [Oscillospiraceae bacterium]
MNNNSYKRRNSHLKPIRDIKKQRKKSNKFRLIYSVITLSSIAVIFIALLTFNSFLLDYEKTRPENILNNFIDQLYKASVTDNYSFIDKYIVIPGSFESGEACTKSLYDKIKTDLPVAVKELTSGQNKSEYKLYVKEDYIATVVLKLEDKKSAFGFDIYNINSIEDISGFNKAVTITIPSECKLFINGIAVSSEYIKNTFKLSQEDCSFALSDKYSTMNTYYVDKLIDPVIAVKDENGKSLDLVYDNNKPELGSTVNFQNVSFIVPYNYSVSVNGVRIDNEDRFYTKDSNADETLTASLSKYKSSYLPLLPYYKYYTVKYLTNEPDVKICSYDGSEVKAEYNSQKKLYTVKYGIAESRKTEYSNFIKDFSLLYSKYITTDAAYSDISGYLLKGTDIEYILNPKNEQIQPEFYTKHIGYEFKDIEISELTEYSTDFYSGRIKYNQLIKKTEYDTRSFPCNFTYYVIRINGKWFILDYMINIS